jgi:aminopeptidase N
VRGANLTREEARGRAALPADKRDELLKPYVAKYFSVVEDAWRSRTHEIATRIATGLYPVLVIEQATVDATETWLADTQPVPALRRLVVENADTVMRCLNAQAMDRVAGR